MPEVREVATLENITEFYLGDSEEKKMYKYSHVYKANVEESKKSLKKHHVKEEEEA